MSFPFKTLAEGLEYRAARDAQRLSYAGHEVQHSGLAALHTQALHRLGQLQQRGLKPGSELIILEDDLVGFLQAFWAAQLGGIVPAPVAVGGNSEHRLKLFRIYEQLQQPWIYTSAETAERYRTFATERGLQAQWARMAERIVLPELGAEPGSVQAVSSDRPAFIQFSSGSTGLPKGVVLSHDNLLCNIAGIHAAAQLRDEETTYSWMPLTHDLGLIGFHLTPLLTGMHQCLMPSELFARRPLMWLERVSELKAQVLCSPNFGYRHWLKAAEGKPLDLDLSQVRLIFNGAEPISAAMCRQFLARLAGSGLKAETMFPVYGLAEASLAVSFPPPGTGLSTLQRSRRELAPGAGLIPEFTDAESSVECVCLGAPVPGCEVRIADAEGVPLPDDKVGRILIRGGNVTRGYYRRDGLDRSAIDAEGWFDTGDLGFIGLGGLYVSGRAKDVMFVNGRNFYLHDVEEVAAACAGAAPGKLIACALRMSGDEHDQALLFVLHRGAIAEFAPQAKQLKEQVAERLGLALEHVLPIRTIPKTTSGKLQRNLVAQQFVAGEFAEAVAALAPLLDAAGASPAASGSELEQQLKRICDQVLGDTRLRLDDNLFDVCASSLALAQIHEGIEAAWPGKVDVTDLFDHPTVSQLAKYLESRLSGS